MTDESMIDCDFFTVEVSKKFKDNLTLSLSKAFMVFQGRCNCFTENKAFKMMTYTHWRSDEAFNILSDCYVQANGLSAIISRLSVRHLLKVILIKGLLLQVNLFDFDQLWRFRLNTRVFRDCLRLLCNWLIFRSKRQISMLSLVSWQGQKKKSSEYS